MKDAKDVLTLTVVLGFGLAILLNADQAATVIKSVSSAWFNLLSTVSGTNKNQVISGR